MKTVYQLLFAYISSRSLRAAFLAVLISFLAIGTTACGGLFFYPQRALVASPEAYKIPFHDIYFDTEDGLKLHAWYLPAIGKPKGTILHFHGNAQNMSTHIFSVYWLPKFGYDVVTFDYRGFGKSEGKASLPEIVIDGRAAIKLASDLSTSLDSCLVVFGQSIGGALAILALDELNGAVPVNALVVDSSFANFNEVAKMAVKKSWLLWPLQPLVPLLLPRLPAPEELIANFEQLPVLVIHGDSDQVIPISQSLRLYEAVKGPKEFWQVPDTAHIQAMGHAKLREEFVDYLDDKCSSGFELVVNR